LCLSLGTVLFFEEAISRKYYKTFI